MVPMNLTTAIAAATNKETAFKMVSNILSLPMVILLSFFYRDIHLTGDDGPSSAIYRIYRYISCTYDKDDCIRKPYPRMMPCDLA